MDFDMTIYIRQHQIEALKAEHTKRKYFVGLDLGQSVDYTAYCVLEQVSVPQLQIGPIGKTPLTYDTTYHITYLDRLPLRTTYPDIIKHVKTLLVRWTPALRQVAMRESCSYKTLAGLRPACGQRNGPAVGSDGGGERPTNFWWRMIP
jgi:hypothetical protein